MNEWRAMRCSFGLLFSILLFSNCTSSQKEDDVATADTSHYVPKDVSTPTGSKAHLDTVEIIEMKFQPSVLAAHYGDTVIWINHDMVAHCVTEENSKAWTSLPIPAGASWKMVVTQSSNYYCAIHEVMKGRIAIEDF